MNSSNNHHKKSIIKSQNLKSSFLTDSKTNNHVVFKNIQKNSNNFNFISIRKTQKLSSFKLSKKKSSEVNYLDSDNNEKDEGFKSDDYEDLFFYFLLHIEKIEYFENLLKYKKQRKINNKYYFTNIFESLTGQKNYWNNFYFPKYVFILFYLKSRKLQKEIFKYSISKGKEIMEVINSYNKKYTSLMKIKNWKLKPVDAYANYEKIHQNERSEIEKINKNTISKINSFTDFVIRTDNKGKGKTLIFLGKTINIYIDDLEAYQNKNHGLSMDTEDSEFNKKVKNEIVYTFDEAAIKAKKGNLTINNNNNHKILRNINNTRNNLSLSKKKYKKINKVVKYMNLNKGRLKLKYNEKNNNKKEFKHNLFNDYMKHSTKLPLLNISKRHYNDNTELTGSKSKEKNYSILKEDKLKKWFKPKVKEINKRSIFNSFRKYNFDDKKENKTIINFFSKKDNDFYY